MTFLRTMLALAGMLLMAAPALADDWQADRLRGQVLQLVDGQWQKLDRGDVVPDSRVVRTLAGAHVTFTRGTETVTLGPNTQIQIFDQAAAKPFTTVKEYFGAVSIEADVRNVQHFAVDTPYLAAVVKGTRFTVISSKRGASVSVDRGHVLVSDKLDKTHVTITVGQSATVALASGVHLTLAGKGPLPKVLDAAGKPVASAAPMTLDELKAAAKAAAEQAKLLKTPEARAAAQAAKEALHAAEKAAKDAAKAAKDAAKAADKAAKTATNAAAGTVGATITTTTDTVDTILTAGNGNGNGKKKGLLGLL